MLTSRLNMARVQDGSSKIGLERILTPISSLAGWVMVVAGVLSSVQVGLSPQHCFASDLTVKNPKKNQNSQFCYGFSGLCIFHFRV